MIPERVLLEMAKPIIHHRTPAFEKVMEKVRCQLRWIFQTENEVLLQASVGSGAMEAAVVNCFSPKDKVVIVNSGKFSERWLEQCKAYGLNAIDLKIPSGEAIKVETVKELLDSTPEVRGIFCQACETSTGVAHPIEALGRLIGQYYDDTIFLVDAITALGISEIRTDAWNLDVVVTGSQKALMLPPGLSMLSFSPKAFRHHKEAKLPRYYFDVTQALASQAKNQTTFTPPISLIQGLSVSLDMMEEEGLKKLFARHKRLAHATRESMKAIGLKLFSQIPSDSITAVYSPNGIDGEKIVSHLQEKYNFTIIGGQGHLKGKIFRLGHMGYCGDFDVISMIAATEMTLVDLGFAKKVGPGVETAARLLHGEI